MLQQGGWWAEQGTAQVPPIAPPPLPQEPQPPSFFGSEDEYPLHLIVFPSNSWLAGEVAHLPWLQALPDPATTVVWNSWLEINPATAEQLKLETGDIIEVQSPQGTVQVPAYIHPATPPNIVGIPAGQGHRHYTRYAEGRGVNPLEIVAPMTDSETGALAWAATRVKLTKTGQSIRLSRFEGTVPPLELPDAEILPIVTT
jgi:anaerobic selenocysteine-containing dehydrogenase